MKILRPLFLCSAAVAVSALFSACGQAYDTDYHGSSVSIEPSHNFLGIVKTTPDAYIPVNETTVRLRSSEIYAGRDISGNNVSLFWGLITYTDY